MLCIKSHNPHSSPYPATAAQQVTPRVHCHYSTSDHHVQCRAAMPHLLCRATQSWGFQLVTKNDEGVKWNRPIVHWPLTHYYTACMFHAHFMHYTESDHQKLGGPIHCWSPQPKSWGTCLPRSPWLLRLCPKHWCCIHFKHSLIISAVSIQKFLNLHPITMMTWV